MSFPAVSLHGILPPEGEAMPRHRYQTPSVLRDESGPRPYWYIRYRVDQLTDANTTKRAEVRKVLGYCDEKLPNGKTLGKREAERRRNDIMRDVNRSDYIVQSQIPFPKLAAAYRRVHFPTLRGESSRRLYESFISNHIEPYFKTCRLMDMTPLEIQRWVNGLKLAHTTRTKVVGILHSMFERAADWGYWEARNPVGRVTIGAKNGARDKRIPTLEEIKRLIASLDDATALMVKLGMWTGMRISEIVGLHWRHVDLEHGIVHVVERYYNGVLGPTKRQSSNRDLPLGYLVDELKLWKRESGPDDLVFTNRFGGYVNGNHVSEYRLKRAAKALGIDKAGFAWHTMRRLHLTHFQEKIADETRQQAGHSNAAMTAVYVEASFKRREDTVRAMQEAMFTGAHKA